MRVVLPVMTIPLDRPAAAVGPDFMRERPGAQVLFHSWWNGPMVWPVERAAITVEEPTTRPGEQARPLR